MTRYTSLGIRNNEHPVLHSEDKTSPETGIRKRGVSGFSGLASFLLSVYPSQSEHEELQISHTS